MEGIHTLKSLLRKGDWLVKVDLKDAYFSIPISRQHRKFLCFQFKNKLSVELSFLWPGLSPMGLYQDPEADSSSRTRAGDANDSIYRRYPLNGRDQGESQRPSIRPDIPHAMLGLHDKLGEDHFRTIPTPRVLGFYGGYHQHGAKPPCAEDQEDSGGVPAVIRGGAYYSPRPLQIIWQNECHEPSDTTSSPVLQEPSDGPCSSIETRQPGLRDEPGALSRQQGGAEMMGHTDGKVEWQDGASVGARPDHRVGHLNPGLGSLSPRHQHQGTLVPPGEGMAHQLPGTASGDSSPKNLRKEQEGDISVTKDRQHNSSCLQGGTASKELLALTQDLWMWCLERNIHIQAQHLPGGRQEFHVCQVADMEFRSMRDRSNWKLDRQIFLKVNRCYGPLEVDLFASRLTNQCCCYFSWRPDLFAEATDAFLQDWRIMPTHHGIGAQGTEESSVSGSRCDPNSPHMDMVLSPVGNVSRLAMPATQAGTQYRVSAHNAPTGRVEHLRERLGSQGLSGQAADLILKSWRTKTNKSYD